MAPDAADTAKGRPAQSYDGQSAAVLGSRLRVSAVHLYASVASTMDVAHGMAGAGAPAGTLILAEEQTAGRGRKGTPWHSPPARGIWFTLIERPADASGLEVLSLRVGLTAAAALDAFAEGAVRVKWPNDLFVGAGKLAGVLVEARWRAGRPDWVAIGIGANVRPPPGVSGAAGLREAASRVDVLSALVSAVRGAAARRGALDASELNEFAVRDYARGRRCVTPARGVVMGVTADGRLVVRTAVGVEHHRAGSLVLEEVA